MSDKNINYMIDCLKAGLLIWWVMNNQRVFYIAPHPDEPSLCAFLGGVGGYLALYNAAPEDFIITSPDIARWNQ